LIKYSKYLIPYVILIFLLGYRHILILELIVVITHELIHYLFALYFGFSGFYMEMSPIGLSINLKDIDEATISQDIIISISAPLMNLIFSFIFLYFYNIYGYIILYQLHMINQAVFIINIIPAFPLDGGRVLRDIIYVKKNYKASVRITSVISIILGAVIILLYVFLLFLKLNNLSLLIIGIFIISSAIIERKRLVYLIMADVVKKKWRFLKNKYLENYSISIYYKSNLIEGAKLIDKKRYAIFYVLDEELCPIGMISEGELFQGLKNKGNITFIQLLNEKRL